MKIKVPAQLILITLLLGLSIAGWIFIDSCKSQLHVKLETVQGDASYLDDKKISFRYEAREDSGVSARSDLDVRFPNEETKYSFSSKMISTEANPIEYRPYSFDRFDHLPWQNFSRNGTVRFPADIIRVENDFESLIKEYDPNGLLKLRYEIVSDYDYGFNEMFITIDEITYCTIRSAYCDSIYIESSYMSNGEEITSDYDSPVMYTARSGIWAFDDEDTSSDGIMENVVPYQITGPSGPQVFGIYAIESEKKIVLVSVENNTDLYVTFYDTKTKSAQEPVMIYHSESGAITPYIMPPNETCSMGSFYVLVSDENGSNKGVAISLNKNQATGAYESASYPLHAYKSTDLSNYNSPRGYSPFVRSFYDLDMEGTVTNRFLNPEFFYLQDELWLISHDAQYDYPGLIVMKYWTEFLHMQCAAIDIHKYYILVYYEGVLRYEGVLSVDLPVNALNNRLEADWDKHLGDYYPFRTDVANDLSTWITITSE